VDGRKICRRRSRTHASRTLQVSLRNRVLILFDWAKTRVFGRDLSQF
jgi:hypothetical protein